MHLFDEYSVFDVCAWLGNLDAVSAIVTAVSSRGDTVDEADLSQAIDIADKSGRRDVADYLRNYQRESFRDKNP